MDCWNFPLHQEDGLNALAEDWWCQEILHEFDLLSGDATKLPPYRDCDHRIPLMQGADLSMCGHIATHRTRRVRLSVRCKPC
jgi:hypothetical protein